MVGIAAIALVMFALGIHLHLKLRGKGFQSVRETTWRRWLEHPRRLSENYDSRLLESGEDRSCCSRPAPDDAEAT